MAGFRGWCMRHGSRTCRRKHHIQAVSCRGELVLNTRAHGRTGIRTGFLFSSVKGCLPVPNTVLDPLGGTRWVRDGPRLQEAYSLAREREKGTVSSRTRKWQNDKICKEVQASAAQGTETQSWERIKIAYWLLGRSWEDKFGFLKGGGRNKRTMGLRKSIAEMGSDRPPTSVLAWGTGVKARMGTGESCVGLMTSRPGLRRRV